LVSLLSLKSSTEVRSIVVDPELLFVSSMQSTVCTYPETMSSFLTRALSDQPDEIAPDLSEVRVLVRDSTATMAHFTLPPHTIAVAVKHRTVSEYWYVIGGTGRIWREDADGSEITDLTAGVSLSLPLGTAFQFRNDGDDPLTIVGFDSPPWPGNDEAFVVEGAWEPTP
jgi:mannose-6-phosphate isomerase-like protein (cupin superfamily)